MPIVDAATLAQVFAPFMEWPYLSRDEKRRILSALAPEIKAADYQIEGMSIGLLGNSNMGSRWKWNQKRAKRVTQCIQL